MKLSIILPVYNVEPYLERCLRSLLDQDLPREEYEIIVVNDGSPDNSREVAIRLMKEASNIVLIDQENRGVSMARNAGMERARGEFILFVDPDDYILPNRFRHAVELAENFDAQVVTLGYRFLLENGEALAELLHQDYVDQVFSGIDAYYLSRGDGKVDPDRSVGMLFRRSFLEQGKLRYIAGVPYLEDGELLARLMCLATRCVFSGRPFYTRTTRPGSATNSDLFFKDRSIQGFIKAASSLQKFRLENELSQQQRQFLNQPICKFALLALTPCCSIRRMNKFNEVIKVLAMQNLRQLDVTGCNGYYRLEGTLYNVWPWFYFAHRALGAPILRWIDP